MKHWSVYLTAVAIAAMVGACGSSTGTAETDSATKRKERAAAERQRERAEAQANYEDCQERLSDFQEALQELNSRLTVGLSYDDYSTEVGDVRVVYDRIDFDALGTNFDCLEVGVSLEKAMNEYVQAASTWNDCITDFDCSSDSIRGRLQKRWARASRLLDRADRELEKIREP